MKRLLATLILTLAIGTAAWAQTPSKNTAFQSGETLRYDLYFNWKFVWVNVGSASMSTTKSKYKGKDAYRSSLVTRSSSKYDKLFMLRDTLLSYTDMGLSPLYFRKGAREGDRYYVDEIWYSYPNGNCQLKQHRIEHTGEHKWKESAYKDCIYDMMSIFMRARNFDASGFTVGQNIPLPISDAKRLSNSWIKYQGKDEFEIEGTKKKFRCLVFSFIEREDGHNKEIIRFYVTDDANHIPVRLDMFLKFGSAKAFLKGYKGVRSKMTSLIK